MMISVPGTPFGVALGQFLMLFEKRPQSLAHLHEAYTSLSILAAREHPEMPWPQQMTYADGLTCSFTVENILFSIRKLHTEKSTTSDAVAEQLALWNSAKVDDPTVWNSDFGPELRLYLAKKYEEPKKTYPKWATLAVSCPWRLLKKNVVLCSSNDTDSQIGNVFSAALKRAKLLDSRIGPEGGLVLIFSAGAFLEVRPHDFCIGPHYSLHLGNRSYYQFDEGFFASESSADEEGEEPSQKE